VAAWRKARQQVRGGGGAGCGGDQAGAIDGAAGGREPGMPGHIAGRGALRVLQVLQVKSGGAVRRELGCRGVRCNARSGLVGRSVMRVKGGLVFVVVVAEGMARVSGVG
jgi:hypothetical protein